MTNHLAYVNCVAFHQDIYFSHRVCTLRIVRLEVSRALEQDLNELVISVSMRVSYDRSSKAPLILLWFHMKTEQNLSVLALRSHLLPCENRAFRRR